MPEKILTSEAPSPSSQLNPSSRIICRLCQKQFSQYTCPRCNTGYCSLQCYKSHSLRCTESLMRENVVAELQQLQPDDETKQKMLDILGRFHSKEEMDSMDEDDSTLSEETIQTILSGGQISVDDLSDKEKECFQRAVASGELSKLIEPWDPWWLKPSARTISLSQEGTQLVQPLVKQETEASPQHDRQNDQLHDIPPGPETPLPPRLIQAAERELKLEEPWKSKSVEIKGKLKSAERKVYFIMCWVHEQPGEAWSSLAAIVKAEQGAAMDYGCSKKGTLNMEDKVETRGKALIEELQ